MKLLLLTLAILGFTNIASAQVHVDGYYKKNGTYVQPHYRSSPDSSKSNNWSAQGNSNPYTGQRGTQNPSPSYGGNNSYGGGNTWGSNNSNLNTYGR